MIDLAILGRRWKSPVSSEENLKICECSQNGLLAYNPRKDQYEYEGICQATLICTTIQIEKHQSRLIKTKKRILGQGRND